MKRVAIIEACFLLLFVADIVYNKPQVHSEEIDDSSEVIVDEPSLNWTTNFFFYPRNRNDGLIKFVQREKISDSIFDAADLPTIFIVHGFKSDAFSRNLQKIKDQFNKYVKSNVIIVDWREGAEAKSVADFTAYKEAHENTKIVGKAISNFISSNKIPAETVTCIGHSLGAHACAFAGKYTPGFGRISGIDPAGPLFKDKPKSERLDSSDAKLVDCIFTTDFVGIDKAICHLNFFPNLFLAQPQCSLIDLVCLHSAGLEYYAESIRGDSSCTFKATKCDNEEKYFLNFNGCNCTNTMNCVQMGYYAKRFSESSGKFYLKTQKNAPYCIN